LVFDIESADKLVATIDVHMIGSMIAGIGLKNVSPAFLSTHSRRVSTLIRSGKMSGDSHGESAKWFRAGKSWEAITCSKMLGLPNGRFSAYNSSTPLVLGYPSLQPLFQLRICVAPEVTEVLGDLHGAVAGSEDLDAHADAAIGV
jgi:hypothetical protein